MCNLEDMDKHIKNVPWNPGELKVGQEKEWIGKFQNRKLRDRTYSKKTEMSYR